uniref:Uncharacterized protein n=1 Tax=Anguilla anguilla TaxID=7936 RepID=A0A0E9XYH9_ANGAN
MYKGIGILVRIFQSSKRVPRRHTVGSAISLILLNFITYFKELVETFQLCLCVTYSDYGHIFQL